STSRDRSDPATRPIESATGAAVRPKRLAQRDRSDPATPSRCFPPSFAQWTVSVIIGSFARNPERVSSSRPTYCGRTRYSTMGLTRVRFDWANLSTERQLCGPREFARALLDEFHAVQRTDFGQWLEFSCSDESVRGVI